MVSSRVKHCAVQLEVQEITRSILFAVLVAEHPQVHELKARLVRGWKAEMVEPEDGGLANANVAGMRPPPPHGSLVAAALALRCTSSPWQATGLRLGRRPVRCGAAPAGAPLSAIRELKTHDDHILKTIIASSPPPRLHQETFFSPQPDYEVMTQLRYVRCQTHLPFSACCDASCW